MGGPSAYLEVQSDRAAGSQLSDFMRFCEHATGRDFPDQAAFHDFSVKDQTAFWRLLLDWSRLAVEGSPEPVCTSDACEHATFFPELRLNYAESLLAGDPAAPALVAHHASGPPDRLSRGEVRERVLGSAAYLRALGVGSGDRVAAVAGNNAEAVVAGLACAAVGATFSTAAPEMGVPAVVSRFEQLEPKILMADTAVDQIAAALPSVTSVISLSATKAARDVPLERFPFNHPLFVLFTSGTTGPPKCIVHGAGGTLLEHVKEHRLHVDLRPGERLFFHTSAAWMMWNWQLSALASGAELVLYDGPIAGPETLWRLVEEERVTVFGTSPPYLQLCEDSGYSPRSELELGDLRSVLSTGSILHDGQYDWVAEHVGQIPVQSISGGTDIIGCFVLGSPNLPVRRGWIQCRSLAMDVQALDGELVCRNPFPSRPLHLMGDDDGSRFHETYFSQNPGVWTHGDLIEFDADGHARMHGRSDGVINIQGQRVGPAEIYRALRDMPEVVEAMAVEHEENLVLLVVPRANVELDGRLIVRIRQKIARATTPAHVPELVVAVEELPTTHSGKRSERAARDALGGGPSVNGEALANPGSLAAIRAAVDTALAARPRAPEELDGSTEARLTSIWESVLGIAPLQPDDDFFDLGGTSLAALRLLEAIHEHMAVDLPLSVLLDAPTIALMRAAIEGPSAAGNTPLVLLRPGPAERPLFLVHALFGDALSMRPLAQHLETDRPVYGLQARGLDPAVEPHTTVADMADAYVESIREVQPCGPYAVGGHSLGGIVAFEMARRLVAQGDEVEWLGMIDSDLHHSALTLPERTRWLLWKAGDLLRRGAADPRGRLPRWSRKAVLRFAPRAPLGQPAGESLLPPLVRRLENAGWAAFDSYRPAPYPGAASFFRVEHPREDQGDPLPIWRRMVLGGLTVDILRGSHADVVAAPNVRALAARVSAQLPRSASGQRSRHS